MNNIIETKNLNLYYGEKQALKSIDMSINKNEVTKLNTIAKIIFSLKMDGSIIPPTIKNKTDCTKQIGSKDKV